jgi:hypothetical protein
MEYAKVDQSNRFFEHQLWLDFSCVILFKNIYVVATEFEIIFMKHVYGVQFKFKHYTFQA